MFEKRIHRAESMAVRMKTMILNRSSGDQESVIVADVVKMMQW
jgi:hypothetical protein